MRYGWIATAALWLMMIASAGASEILLFRSGDFERRVIVDRAAGVHKRPLVVVLHGNGQRPEDIEGRMDWKELVDKGEIVAIFPEGLNQAWADGRPPQAFLGKKPVEGVDDVAFLSELVAYFVRDGVADAKRVYVAGMSNGGMMTYRLMCERPEIFSGGAVIAASLTPDQANQCNPVIHRPMVIINGTADRVIPFDATDDGAIKKGSVQTIGTMKTVEKWRKVNGCGDDMSAENLPDRDSTDNSTVTRLTWKCPSGQRVELYQVNGGGHRIPALAGTVRVNVLDNIVSGQNRDIDAAHEIWAFFAQATSEHGAHRLGNNTQ